MMRFRLERYAGPATRHKCPDCGQLREFSRYIDIETGDYIAEHVGRCNRELSCGYHFTPNDYFSENGFYQSDFRSVIASDRWVGRDGGRDITNTRPPVNDRQAPVFIDRRYLIETLCGYETNTFVNFLLGLFEGDSHTVFEAVKDYYVGTKRGFTIFPFIDRAGRVCKGQARTFDVQGHRQRESSLEHLLKQEGKLSFDFETDKRVLFGEHLLSKYPHRHIALVEAPKTAVIASICRRVFPDWIWLAAGALSWLNASKVERVGRGRQVFLFPDANAYEKWEAIAREARKQNLNVVTSDLIENLASESEREKGYDLADYLIREQHKRNDPVIRRAFAEGVEERLAIMTEGQDLTLSEAENRLESSGFLLTLERGILCD